MADSYPLWFEERHFAEQKLLQMRILGQDIPAGDTPEAQLDAAIAAWNADPANAGNQVADAYANFEACNTQTPQVYAGISSSQVNVSPNHLFDVAYYLTAVAKYANDSHYTTGSVADGGWNAENALQHMWEDGHLTAWEHFSGAESIRQRLDCSENFSTGKYIAAKARLLGVSEGDVIDEMIAAGRNPVEDYFESGMNERIPEAELAVDTPLPVIFQEGEQWGTIAPADPYDDYEAPAVVLEKDNLGPYSSNADENTEFTAKWLNSAAESTLNPDAEIVGGANALNTLTVELGRNWSGFNGVGEDSAPNVRGVGRIKIDRQENAAAEQPLSFDAKNIEGAEQFDVNAAGTGATSLTNLGDTVRRVNYANNRAQDVGSETTQAASLSWAAGEYDGKLPFTIGVNNVCSAGGVLAVNGLENVKELVVDARGGTANNIDVESATDAATISVTGAADVNVRAKADSTLKTLDASAATGDVTFTMITDGVVNQTIKGGSGHDTVGIHVSGTTATTVAVRPADWTSIEAVSFSGNDNATVSFDAANVQGLTDIWMGNDGEYRVRNLAASDIVVHHGEGNNGSKANVVNGNTDYNQLGNLTWITDNKNKADFSSNATGTVTINGYENAGALGDGSAFTFSETTKVVMQELGPLTAAGSNPGDGYTGTGITLNAAKANTLDIDVQGGLKFAASRLGELTDLSVKLQDVSATTNPNDFNMAAVELPKLSKATIDAGGEDVSLGEIGTYSATAASADGPGFTLNINEANTVTLEEMGARVGGNITVNITDATGNITLDNIATSTNQSVNGQGDVSLKFSTTGSVSAASKSITGGDLNIDFSDVLGSVAATGTALKLSAQETISYQGAVGGDYLEIGDSTNSAVAEDSTSFIRTGLGDDNVKIAAGALADGSTLTVDLGDGAGGDKLEVAGGAVTSGGTATLNVICGAGAGEIDIAAQTAGTRLICYIDGFEAGADKVSTFTASKLGSTDTVGLAKAFKDQFDVNIGSDGQVVCVDSAYNGADVNGYYVGGNLYMLNGSGSGNQVLVVLQGVTLDGSSFDLDGDGSAAS